MIWQLFYELAHSLRRIYWFIVHPNTRGVKVVIAHEGKYLFIKHGYGARRWTLPGGGVKKSETPEAAAKREVWEEVRLDLHALRPIGSFVTTLEYKQDTVHCFFATTLREKPILHRGEVIAYGWFPKDDLPSDISLNSKLAFELLETYSHKN